MTIDKKLIIHCGMTKTGSSSIQTFFNTLHRDAEYSTFYYPKSDHFFGAHHESVVHIDLQKKMIEEIQECEKKTIIISEENLFRRDWKPGRQFFIQMKKLFKSIRVVLYVRHQIDWIQSIYQQFASQWDHRYANSIFEFERDVEKDLNYLNIVKYIHDELGLELIVRDYNQALVNGGSIADFCQTIAYDAIVPQATRWMNRSFTRPKIEVIRHLNASETIQDRQIYDSFIEYIREINVSPRRYSYFNTAELNQRNNLARKLNAPLANLMPQEHFESLNRDRTLGEKHSVIETNDFANLVYAMYTQSNT